MYSLDDGESKALISTRLSDFRPLPHPYGKCFSSGHGWRCYVAPMAVPVLCDTRNLNSSAGARKTGLGACAERGLPG
jgi:hypothetical protein